MATEKSRKKNTVNEVIDIIKFMGENSLASLELETQAFNLKLKKHNQLIRQTLVPSNRELSISEAVSAQTSNVKKAESPKEPVSKAKSITAPMSGTFYAAPDPESKPFVKVGDFIEAGQTICIIEAMKTMNEIHADKSGKVLAIKQKNGEPIAKGDEIISVDENK